MINGYNFKKWGTGRRPLIFLHDFGGSGLCWQWIARQMPGEYVCYAPDIPGFGSSRAVDNPSLASLAGETLAVLNGMEMRNQAPSVIAHGFSVALVLKMLAISTQKWQQLVFINPSFPVGAYHDQSESVRMTKHPDRQVAMETVRRSTNRPLKADRLSLAVESQLMADSGTWQWWLGEGCRENVDPLPILGCPLTILCSVSDSRVDRGATQHDIACHFPAAVVREHPTAGHLLPLEDDIWVSAQLCKALPSHTRSRIAASGTSVQK